MDPALKKIIQNNVDLATAEATKQESDRCMTILEIALKTPHAASDDFLTRMSFALDLMQDTACSWSEAKSRFSKMESGAEPTATAETGSVDLEARQAAHLQAALSKKPATKNSEDLGDQIVSLLQGDRSFVH